jgi:hypothetical protein
MEPGHENDLIMHAKVLEYLNVVTHYRVVQFLYSPTRHRKRILMQMAAGLSCAALNTKGRKKCEACIIIIRIETRGIAR